MTGSHHTGKKWFTCPGCGKRAYSSRRDAKTALRNHPTPGGMHTYRCIDTPAVWHYGHDRGLTRQEHRDLHAGKAGAQ
ncbi:hypothetical protein AXK57_22065 [Tsukamurella pulmonis]|nr:hypothetical protein AXK57_22065 [Tsukamurella pulmonis]